MLWRVHCTVSTISANVPEPSSGPSTPTSTSSNALVNIIADKSRKRRIEGPIHVLRGHLREVLSCCVSSDLGIIVSCSQSSDVLLHSIRRGRLIRRLIGVEANAVCLSSDGIIMAWNETRHTLSTFTLNGIVVASVELPFSGSIGCMEFSFDGQTALVGVNSCSGKEGSYNINRSWQSIKRVTEALSMGSDEKQDEHRLDIPSPSICFLDLYSLKVLHTLKLEKGQDITAIALNKDNTNLLVSTMDKQLVIFTDPALSLKVVDQMLKLGWEGDGLSPLIK